MSPKDADRMINSADPDQALLKEQSDLGLPSFPRLSVGKLRIITVYVFDADNFFFSVFKTVHNMHVVPFQEAFCFPFWSIKWHSVLHIFVNKLLAVWEISVLIILQKCIQYFIVVLKDSDRFCQANCKLSLVGRNPVFRVCDQVRHKLACSATEAS